MSIGLYWQTKTVFGYKQNVLANSLLSRDSVIYDNKICDYFNLDMENLNTFTHKEVSPRKNGQAISITTRKI